VSGMPSLARERTQLGRQRSRLALYLIAALLLGGAARRDVPAGAVAGALLAVAALRARSPLALSGATALAAAASVAVVLL